MIPKGSKPITLEQVKAKAKVDEKRPDEKAAIAAFGEKRIERTYREDGNYSWKVKLQTNEAGKPTKDGMKLQELFMPWAKADSERQAAIQGSVERAALMDEAGSVQYVAADQADAAAKRNGWRHRWRVKGKPVMRTNGRELYRWQQDRWVKVG